MFAYDVPLMVNGIDKMTDVISYEQKQFDWADEYLLSGSVQAALDEANTGLIVYEPKSDVKVGDIVK